MANDADLASNNGAGFTRSQLANVATVEVSLPFLYPSTIKEPFTIFMRLQTVKEAQEAQTQFLALSDDDQESATHEYDAKMISILSTKAPIGFSDFPKIEDDDPESLRKAIYDYFLFESGTPEEREGMQFICRSLMSKYRRTVNPSEYL